MGELPAFPISTGALSGEIDKLRQDSTDELWNKQQFSTHYNLFSFDFVVPGLS